MKITHFLYNSFLVESGDKKLALDPGGLFFYFFRFTTVIPQSEWASISHIFVTHGDPDHYWHLDRVAKASRAPVICNKTMVRNIDGQMLFLGPRDKGLAFTTQLDNTQTLEVDETIELDGMSISGIKTTHGPLTIKLGPLSKTIVPGPHERVGWGAIGFDIQLHGKRLVNLGDTLLLEKEWQHINKPDVLMIPIGGRLVHNTMGEKEAIQAVKIMQPKLVIPCHYNSPALFSKKLNPADDIMFKDAVEKIGLQCALIRRGESIDI